MDKPEAYIVEYVVTLTNLMGNSREETRRGMVIADSPEEAMKDRRLLYYKVVRAYKAQKGDGVFA